MPDLRNLDRLQKLPELVSKGDAVTMSMFEGSQAERSEFLLKSKETLTFAEMNLEELYLFLFRTTSDATQAWETSDTWWGRMRNRFNNAKLGYIEIPGRVLVQIMRCLDDSRGNAVAPGVTWFLRLDLGLEIRDLMKPKVKSAT